MPSWMLRCQNCSLTFRHSTVDDHTLEQFFFHDKPKFPTDGLRTICPYCDHQAIYQRHYLVYQA